MTTPSGGEGYFRVGIAGSFEANQLEQVEMALQKNMHLDVENGKLTAKTKTIVEKFLSLIGSSYGTVSKEAQRIINEKLSNSPSSQVAFFKSRQGTNRLIDPEKMERFSNIFKGSISRIKVTGKKVVPNQPFQKTALVFDAPKALEEGLLTDEEAVKSGLLDLDFAPVLKSVDGKIGSYRVDGLPDPGVVLERSGTSPASTGPRYVVQGPEPTRLLWAKIGKEYVSFKREDVVKAFVSAMGFTSSEDKIGAHSMINKLIGDCLEKKMGFMGVLKDLTQEYQKMVNSDATSKNPDTLNSARLVCSERHGLLTAQQAVQQGLELTAQQAVQQGLELTAQQAVQQGVLTAQQAVQQGLELTAQQIVDQGLLPFEQAVEQELFDTLSVEHFDGGVRRGATEEYDRNTVFGKGNSFERDLERRDVYVNGLEVKASESEGKTKKQVLFEMFSNNGVTDLDRQEQLGVLLMQGLEDRIMVPLMEKGLMGDLADAFGAVNFNFKGGEVAVTRVGKSSISRIDDDGNLTAEKVLVAAKVEARAKLSEFQAEKGKLPSFTVTNSLLKAPVTSSAGSTAALSSSDVPKPLSDTA